MVYLPTVVFLINLPVGLLYIMAVKFGTKSGGINNSYTKVCLLVRGDVSFGEWIISCTRLTNHGITILYHPHQCRPCSV